MGATAGSNPRASGYRKIIAAVFGVALVATSLAFANSSKALTGSTFESTDGNLNVNGGVTAHDWVNAPNRTFQDDKPSGQNDDSLGQGSSEDNIKAVVNGSIPNNKSDLTRFYTAHEDIAGMPYLYLAWERANTLGTANMDFEFNRNKCDATDPTHSVCAANGVTPARSAGDILITYDFDSGGSNPNKITIGLLTWITSGTCEANGSNPPCWDAKMDLTPTTNPAADGGINQTAITDPISGASLAQFTFGEVAINLQTAGVFQAGVCRSFGSAWLHSRASTSFTAELKDFVAPENVPLANCGTANIHKQDDAGTAMGGIVFNAYAVVGGVTSAVSSGTCTTDATTGSCSISNLPFGTYSFVEASVPNGYAAAAAQQFTFDGDHPTAALTFVDPRVKGTVHVTKHDDASPAGNVPGAGFTLYVDVDPSGTTRTASDTATLLTCSTSAAGTCDITNVPLGDYWLVETTTPNGYATAADQKVHIGLGASPGVGDSASATFVDNRVPGTLVINKLNGSGQPLGGATFTVYVDANPTGGTRGAGDTTAAGSCTTASATSAGPPATVLGQCKITNLPLGEYWVVETASPPGYSTDSDQHIVVGLGSQPNQGQTITLTFTDSVVPAQIDIVKEDDLHAPLPGATFTLYTDAAPLGGSRGAEDTTSNGTCTTANVTVGAVTTATCSFTNVPVGQYWVVETTTPNGYATASPQNVIIGLGGASGVGQYASLTFTDPRVKGTVNVHKQDGAGTALSGATFTLYTDNTPVGGTKGNEDTATSMTCTTAANGDCPAITNVPLGDYWLVETTTPNGYTTAAPQQVHIGLGSAPNTGVTVSKTFVDNVVLGSVTINKHDDAGAPIVAGFTLYNDNAPIGGTRGNEDTASAFSCTTTAGTCTIGSLPLGGYWVVETTTPNGYFTAADQYLQVGLGSTPGTGSSTTLTFTDVRVDGRVDITKVDDAGGQVNGAVLTLYTDASPFGGSRGAGDTISAFTCTTASGTCSILDVPLGDYWVVETTTPNGYATAADAAIEIGLGATPNHGAVVPVRMVDNRVPGSLTIVKLDDASPAAPVEGAVFTLYNDAAPTGGSLGTGDTSTGKTCTTDAQGSCSIASIPVGEYWVRETTTPNGYATAADQHLTIGLGSQPNQGDVEGLTFIDHIVPGTITVLKLDDSTPAKPLSGAEFTLYTDLAPQGGSRGAEDTSTETTCTTDATGTCSFTSVALGQYWVVESQTPAAHATASDQHVTIGKGTAPNQGATATLTFIDPVLPASITLDKTVAGADHATPADALVVHQGDALAYKVVIKNTGQVDLTIEQLVDTLKTNLAATCDHGIGFVLVPGATITCTYTSTAGSDANNVASVSGLDILGRTVTAHDGTFVDVINPAISITKTPSPTTAAGGDVVTFTYVVTNTGDTTLTNVVVTDDVLGAVGTVATLAPGQSVTFTKTETVDSNGATPVSNIGTASGTDVLGKTVTSQAKATITIVLPLVIPRPPAQVAPTVLAKTGAPIRQELTWAALLLLLGVALQLTGRRRSTTAGG